MKTAYAFLLLAALVLITAGCIAPDGDEVPITPVTPPAIIEQSHPAPVITTLPALPTPTTVITERWSHGVANKEYDACDQIHRDYNVYTSWRQEADGTKYCLIQPRDPDCDGYGCWWLKVPIDEIDNTDLDRVLGGR